MTGDAGRGGAETAASRGYRLLRGCAATNGAMVSVRCAGSGGRRHLNRSVPRSTSPRAFPVDGEWRGLTVIMRIEGEDPVSVLAR
jgi:hypothetical protein